MSEELTKSLEMETYFCVLCQQLICFRTQTDLEKHLRESHFNDDIEGERHAIDLWIERHIKYQESLCKSMAQTVKTIPDRSKTVYRGCPVCDRILTVYNIGNDRKSSDSNHELLIRDINVDYSGNNVNHINPHLKYYPFECLLCEEEAEKSIRRGDKEMKEVVKTSVKPMMRRHVIDRHLKDSSLQRNAFEEEVEKSIRTLKVTALERITKRQNPLKSSHKGRKRQSTPGPLREGPKPTDSAKRLRPITPTTPPLFVGKSLINMNDQKIPILVPLAPIVPKTEQLAYGSAQSSMEWKPIKAEVKEEEEMITSEEELSDCGMDSMDDKSRVFGCVFCYKKFLNYEKAFEHYLRHCNVFLECAECELKFKTIVDFRNHNPIHNQNSYNLMHLNEFKIVRKWIQKFLIYTTKERERLIDLCCDVTRIYCPVCLMVSNVFDIECCQPLPTDESIESHIHNHLNYYPYECIDCDYEDIKTEFYLDSNARKHLREKHGIKNADHLNVRELSSYFIYKSSSVHRFDDLIEHSVEISNKLNDFWSVNSKDQTIG